jgi:UDP-N-acetylmuramate--alanine ligase
MDALAEARARAAVWGEVPRADDLDHVHFIGVGGAGMSGLARILLSRGRAVSGSDAKDSPVLVALRALGADVRVGHAAAHLPAATRLVVTTPASIRDTNPELVEAHRRGLRVVPRAAVLAALMADRRGVAVAGTHGKTSTTTMLTVAAQHCGVDPSFAIGGDPQDVGGAGAHHGSGELFVAEADESDSTFLLLHPYAGVVTNIEADHLDHFGSVAAVHAAFLAFAQTVTGFVVCGVDDAGARALAVEAAAGGGRVVTYGTGAGADLRLTAIRPDGDGVAYDTTYRGADLGTVRLRVPGAHMAANSAAALLTGLELGLPPAGLVEGLATYSGVRRRFEFKGEAAGVRVYDDYAHHPTEIATQLAVARQVAAGGRVVAVFQPHLYSRTAAFAMEFGKALGVADEVVVMEVYAGREDPVPGVTGALVAQAVPGRGVIFEPSWSAVPAVVAGLVKAGDLVVTMGAGDVTMIGPEVLAALRSGSRSRDPGAVG